jgi:ankyrin repeat protein
MMPPETTKEDLADAIEVMIPDFERVGETDTVLSLWEIVAVNVPQYDGFQRWVDRTYYASRGVIGDLIERSDSKSHAKVRQVFPSFVYKTTGPGSNLLHQAAAIGCVNVFMELVKGGLSLTRRDAANNNPEDYAAERSQLNVLLRIWKLQEGIDVRAAIRFAFINRRHDVIRALMESEIELTNNPGFYREYRYYSEGGWWDYLSWLQCPTEVEVELIRCLNAAEPNDNLHMLHLSVARGEIEASKHYFQRCQWKGMFADYDLFEWAVEYEKTTLALAMVGVRSGNVNLEMPGNCVPPLVRAASTGNLDLVEGLLDRGADVNNAGHSYPENALQMAVRNGHSDVVRALLARNAAVDPLRPVSGEQETFLTSAVSNPEILVQLLLQKPLLEVKNGWGKTPLFEAVKLGQYEAVVILLNHGADIEAVHDPSGETPIHLAASRGSFDVFRLLVHKGANMTKIDNEGKSILYKVAQSTCGEIISFFLDQCTQIDTGVYEMQTMLHIATNCDHTDIMIQLLRRNAKINAKDRYGQTPLHIAAQEGHHKALRLLLDFGADVNARDMGGETPLFSAIRSGWSEYMIRELLVRGADRFIRNFNRKSPTQVAPRTELSDQWLKIFGESKKQLELGRNLAWNYGNSTSY